jgi:hypothetical protein
LQVWFCCLLFLLTFAQDALFSYIFNDVWMWGHVQWNFIYGNPFKINEVGFAFFFFPWDRVSLCSQCCPGACYCPTSTSQVLRLQVCTTTPDKLWPFWNKFLAKDSVVCFKKRFPISLTSTVILCAIHCSSHLLWHESSSPERGRKCCREAGVISVIISSCCYWAGNHFCLLCQSLKWQVL